MFAGPKQSAGTPPPTAPELVMCKSYSKNQFYALAYAIFYYFFIYSRYDRCDQRIVPPWAPPPYDPGVFNSGVRDRTSCKNPASKEVRYSVSPTGECVYQVDTKKYKQNVLFPSFFIDRNPKNQFTPSTGIIQSTVFPQSSVLAEIEFLGFSPC